MDRRTQQNLAQMLRENDSGAGSAAYARPVAQAAALQGHLDLWNRLGAVRPIQPDVRVVAAGRERMLSALSGYRSRFSILRLLLASPVARSAAIVIGLFLLTGAAAEASAALGGPHFWHPVGLIRDSSPEANHPGVPKTGSNNPSGSTTNAAGPGSSSDAQSSPQAAGNNTSADGGDDHQGASAAGATATPQSMGATSPSSTPRAGAPTPAPDESEQGSDDGDDSNETPPPPHPTPTPAPTQDPTSIPGDDGGDDTGDTPDDNGGDEDHDGITDDDQGDDPQDQGDISHDDGDGSEDQGDGSEGGDNTDDVASDPEDDQGSIHEENDQSDDEHHADEPQTGDNGEDHHNISPASADTQAPEPSGAPDGAADDRGACRGLTTTNIATTTRGEVR